MRALELTGQRFGHYTVIRRLPNTKRSKWLCRCDCGERREVLGNNLTRGNSKGCGCSKQTHGMAGSPEHYAWRGALGRCTNPKNKDYPRWGGRGITVCARWRGKTGFDNFYADMGPKPSPKHTLDRYPDKDGNYEPGNCRWATWKQQQRNRRDTITVRYFGRTWVLRELVERVGKVNCYTVYQRLKSGGWPLVLALTKPSRITRSSSAATRRSLQE
jgi:hypothetical protein